MNGNLLGSLLQFAPLFLSQGQGQSPLDFLGQPQSYYPQTQNPLGFLGQPQPYYPQTQNPLGFLGQPQPKSYYPQNQGLMEIIGQALTGLNTQPQSQLQFNSLSPSAFVDIRRIAESVSNKEISSDYLAAINNYLNYVDNSVGNLPEQEINQLAQRFGSSNWPVNRQEDIANLKTAIITHITQRANQINQGGRLTSRDAIQVLTAY